MKHLLLASMLVVPSVSAQLQFQESGRTGTFEVGGLVQWLSGETVDGRYRGRDGDLELEDLIGGGINFGYHINEHLNINTDFLYSNADVNFFSPGAASLHDDGSLFLWTVNLDYYIFPTSFTPYLTGGLGLLGLDNWYEDDWSCCFPPEREIHLSETDFLWNVGGGLRWEATENIVLKLGYRLYGTELEYAGEHMFMHSVLLTVGYHFR
jgi:opacity protein-like surface antigen